MNDFAFEVEDRGLQYVGAERIEGPLIFIGRVRDVGYDEVVEILDPAGLPRVGRVLEVSQDHAIVQVLEGTTGLCGQTLRSRFLGESFRLPVSRRMLGGVFDGWGRPLHGSAAPLTAECRDVNGLPINPYARRYPREFIQTGLSCAMNTAPPRSNTASIPRSPPCPPSSSPARRCLWWRPSAGSASIATPDPEIAMPLTRHGFPAMLTFDLDAELKIWVSSTAAPIQKQFNKHLSIYEVQSVLASYVLR